MPLSGEPCKLRGEGGWVGGSGEGEPHSALGFRELQSHAALALGSMVPTGISSGLGRRRNQDFEWKDLLLCWVVLFVCWLLLRLLPQLLLFWSLLLSASCGCWRCCSYNPVLQLQQFGVGALPITVGPVTVAGLPVAVTTAVTTAEVVDVSQCFWLLFRWFCSRGSFFLCSLSVEWIMGHTGKACAPSS
jgi:hypothetical protein